MVGGVRGLVGVWMGSQVERGDPADGSVLMLLLLLLRQSSTAAQVRVPALMTQKNIGSQSEYNYARTC